LVEDQESEVAMVELSVELEVANHPAALVARVILEVLEEDWEVPEVLLLLRAAAAALVEVAGAAVEVSRVPQASLLLAVAVTAAKVCLPVSPALQASLLATAYKGTH
jgi:hypothetical protein